MMNECHVLKSNAMSSKNHSMIDDLAVPTTDKYRITTRLPESVRSGNQTAAQHYTLIPCRSQMSQTVEMLMRLNSSCTRLTTSLNRVASLVGSNIP